MFILEELWRHISSNDVKQSKTSATLDSNSFLFYHKISQNDWSEKNREKNLKMLKYNKKKKLYIYIILITNRIINSTFTFEANKWISVSATRRPVIQSTMKQQLLNKCFTLNSSFIAFTKTVRFDKKNSSDKMISQCKGRKLNWNDVRTVNKVKTLTSHFPNTGVLDRMLVKGDRRLVHGSTFITESQNRKDEV